MNQTASISNKLTLKEIFIMPGTLSKKYAIASYIFWIVLGIAGIILNIRRENSLTEYIQASIFIVIGISGYIRYREYHKNPSWNRKNVLLSVFHSGLWSFWFAVILNQAFDFVKF